MLPRIGDSVVVRHRSKLNRAGDARLVQEDTDVTQIKAVYPLGFIKTLSGDVFRIRANQYTSDKLKHVQWMTVQ